MPSALQLVIGLGNPGRRYSKTRHNAGFWFADRLARAYAARFQREAKFHGQVARVQDSATDCRVFKPGTFMNESGGPISAIMKYYGIAPEYVLVVHDEVDFEPGVVRLKRGGGHGGHKGLRDIIERLGSGDLLRLRIGVGHPGDRDAVTPFVLAPPGAEERSRIDGAIDRALKVMPLVFEGEFEKAMTELHGSEKLKVESKKEDE